MIAGVRWLLPGAVVAVDRRGTTAAADRDVGHLRGRRGHRSRRGDALAIRCSGGSGRDGARGQDGRGNRRARARWHQRRARQLALDPLRATQSTVAAEFERAYGAIVSLEVRLQR
ncbi:MAG: hypothetical protein ACRDPC_03375 [Solirubrobacteraceae bacterium]